MSGTTPGRFETFSSGRSVPPWFSLMLEVGCAVLLVLAFFNIPMQTDTSLDPSWRMAIAKFLQEGRQFGTEIVFTYGPFGFATARMYNGSGFGLMIAWEILMSLCFSGVILWAARGFSLPYRLLFYGYFLLFGCAVEESLYIIMITLIGLLLVREARSVRVIVDYALAFLLGVMALVKFTNLLLCVLVIGVSVGFDFWEKRRLRGLRVGAGFAITFVAGWVLAGQALRNLPLYFLHSWMISSGYEKAMVVGVESTFAVFGAISLILLVAYGVVCVVTAIDRTRTLAMVSVLAAFSYLIWKHGFTRADWGHIPGFFCAVIFLAVTLFLFIKPSPVRLPVWAQLLPALGVVVAVEGFATFQVTTVPLRYYLTQSLRQHFRHNVEHLIHYTQFRRSYDEQYENKRSKEDLPKTRALVGTSSVDVLGYEQSVALFNRLNYHPRPVFQSYSAYSPPLAKLNESFYLSPESPEFVLQRVDTIDERLPTMDDSLVLASLPQHYAYVFEENGFALWHARPKAPSSDSPRRALRQDHVSVNEKISLAAFAGRPLYVQIYLPLSLLGKLRSFLYHLPVVRVKLEDEIGGWTTWHLSVPLGETGFIINPIITDLSSYVDFAQGKPGRRIRSISLDIYKDYEKYFAPTADFIFSEIVPAPITTASNETTLLDNSQKP